jgi:hypothetical protein
VGLVLATAPFAMAWLPLGSATSADSNGTVTASHPSLIETEGLSVLIVLLVPVVIAAVPLLFRYTSAQAARIVAAVLMAIGVVLAMMSIGIFYVPALIALIVAAASGRSRLAPTTV